jgi:protein farnesyltransferase/geranylgeranyltransferase type-1 subunit alpha
MAYTTSSLWADVVPIPQDDGPNPLVSITYKPEYSEAMDYLRAVMAAGEHSERVLDLTMDVICMNPAHYTVWYVLYGFMLRELSEELDVWDANYVGIGCIEQRRYSH